MARDKNGNPGLMDGEDRKGWRIFPVVEALGNSARVFVAKAWMQPLPKQDSEPSVAKEIPGSTYQADDEAEAVLAAMTFARQYVDKL